MFVVRKEVGGYFRFGGPEEFLSLDFTAAFRIRFHSRARLLEGGGGSETP